MATAQDDLQTVSEIMRNKRRVFIKEIMKLTPQEKEAFWPIYTEFESGLSKIRGKRIGLATYFLQNHGNLSDAEAIAMLNKKLKLDADKLKFKQSYVAKFMKALPSRKVVRFYQAENKFDTAAISLLYENLPLIQ